MFSKITNSREDKKYRKWKLALLCNIALNKVISIYKINTINLKS